MPSRSVAGNLANMGHSSVSSRERSTGSVAQIKCCPVAGSSFSRAHHQLSPQVRLLTCPVLLSVFTYLVVAALIFPFVVAYGTQTRKLSGSSTYSPHHNSTGLHFSVSSLPHGIERRFKIDSLVAPCNLN